MIYSKLIASNDPAKLASGLEEFLRSLNIAVVREHRPKILHITQSETSYAWSGTQRGFEASGHRWHGTISILYEAREQI
jgi:hypothetical protein